MQVTIASAHKDVNAVSGPSKPSGYSGIPKLHIQVDPNWVPWTLDGCYAA